MPLFQFRLTEEDDVKLTNVVLWIRSDCQCLLAVKEVSQKEKKHIHVLLDVKNKSSFVQRFHAKHSIKVEGKIIYSYKGNKSYSCEELREPLENSLKYLSKGDKSGELPIVLFSKYSESEIMEFHNQYYEHPSAQKKEKDKLKKPTLTWYLQVKNDYQLAHAPEIAYLQFKHVKNQWTPTDEEKQHLNDAKYHLFKFLMRRMGKLVKIMDESIIKRLFNGLYNSFVQDDEITSERFNKDLFKSIILL